MKKLTVTVFTLPEVEQAVQVVFEKSHGVLSITPEEITVKRGSNLLQVINDKAIEIKYDDKYEADGYIVAGRRIPHEKASEVIF